MTAKELRRKAQNVRDSAIHHERRGMRRIAVMMDRRADELDALADRAEGGEQ